MRFDNTLVVNAADASVTVTSSAITLENIFGYAIQVVFTGSPVGSLKLQASCDQGSNPINASAIGAGITNWNDIAGTTVAISSAGLTLYNMDAQYYKWVRIVYTPDSGTGTVSARINSKGA